MSSISFKSASVGSFSSYFEPNELSDIINVYTDRVKANEWRDYGFICAKDKTTFVVLDNHFGGQDVVASIQKNQQGEFFVSQGGYELQFQDFSTALRQFRNDFGNRRPTMPSLRVVS